MIPVAATLFLAWGAGGVSLGPTSSLKWGVAVVPDGAGGAVVAWEENRGRKACCRDTRDLYLQRLDAAGKPRWGASDLSLAEEDAGQEMLGLFPAGDGGAFVLFHHGGRLLAQELTGSGATAHPPPGAVLRDGSAACEWAPGSGAAVSADGRRCAVVWAEQGPDPLSRVPRRAALRVLTLARGESGWRWGAPALIAEEPGLHPAALAVRSGGWLACWWRERPDGVELWSRALMPDGSPAGAALHLAKAPGETYLHAEAVSGAEGETWLLWSGVDREDIPPFHEVRVTRVRGRSAATVVAGRAKSSILYIPSTHVTVAVPGSAVVQGPGEAATADFVAWRRMAALVPAGRGSCVVAWLDGQVLQAARLATAGGSLTVSSAAAQGEGVFTGFSPYLIKGAGSMAALWAEKTGEDRWRMMRRSLVADARGARFTGGASPVAEEGGVSPRIASAAEVGGGASVLAWTAVEKGERAVIRAQRIEAP